MYIEKKIARIIELSKEKPSENKKIINLLVNQVFSLFVAPWLLIIPAKAIMSHLPDYFRFWLPRALEQACGIFLLFGGLNFMIWTVMLFWMAGNGTPSISSPSQRLLTNGTYRWSRNPICLGSTAFIFGIGLYFDGLFTGWLAGAVNMMIGMVYIIKIEERELALRFGEPYLKYKQNTPIFFPDLNRISIKARADK
jgi:protein-S-isoprenylcysteine O-methyltransferase Ste14